MASYDECSEVLKKQWQQLRQRDGVLNVTVSNKFSDGRDMGEPAIVFYVKEKKPKSKLLASELIPKKIENCKTDVVELSTSDYELGDTESSKRGLEVQKRMAGGVKK